MVSNRLIILSLLFMGVLITVLSWSLIESEKNVHGSEISDRPTPNQKPKSILGALNDESSKYPSIVHHKSQGKMANDNYIGLKNIDLLELNIPLTVNTSIKNVVVHDKKSNNNKMGVNTYYREAYPPEEVTASGQTVLLLHGQAFKSETWLDLGTINILAAIGHRVVAIDLPGYGETKETLNSDVNKEDYLNEIFLGLQLDNVVLVSPSMSGSFSIPFLIKYPFRLDGYVPVAPVGTGKIIGMEQNIKTPTLLIYGELDKNLGLTSKSHLSVLPNSQVVELPKSRHPAYLDNPDMFHQLLYNFLLFLK